MLTTHAANLFFTSRSESPREIAQMPPRMSRIPFVFSENSEAKIACGVDRPTSNRAVGRFGNDGTDMIIAPWCKCEPERRYWFARDDVAVLLVSMNGLSIFPFAKTGSRSRQLDGSDPSTVLDCQRIHTPGARWERQAREKYSA